MSLKKSEDPVVSGAVLAERYGVSSRHINSLAERDLLARGPGGKQFYEYASTRRYVEHLRKSSSGRVGIQEERLRLVKMQANKIAFENSVAKGKHAPTAVMLRWFAESLGRLRGLMLAIPDRLASRLSHLTRHDIHEIDAEIRLAIQESVETEKAYLDSENKAERDGNDES
jgi:phage terminase Nu1 subunit (DNA packaging protein)